MLSTLYRGLMSSWRHQIEAFSVLLSLYAGNSLATGGFPLQRPVTRSFDVFLDMRLNKWLSKQLRRRRCDMPLRSSWRHCNVIHETTGTQYCLTPSRHQSFTWNSADQVRWHHSHQYGLDNLSVYGSIKWLGDIMIQTMTKKMMILMKT